MPKGVQIAVAAGAIALLLGWYGYSNLESIGTLRYYQTLSEFRSAAEPGEAARVHGYVMPGSITRDVEGRSVRFAVQEEPPHAGGAADAAMPVIYGTLELPDLFKDGAEVVVEGRIDTGRDGTVFVARNVLAKCPSKFQAASAQEAPF
jgi:cytochrome c-type biogenesis protein CcmE